VEHIQSLSDLAQSYSWCARWAWCRSRYRTSSGSRSPPPPAPFARPHRLLRGGAGAAPGEDPAL